VCETNPAYADALEFLCIAPPSYLATFSKLYVLKLPLPKPIEWLYLIGGLLLTLHYFGFQDDSFVFFRYVDNLIFLKAGLVYNRGEYVEGFSSPLWLMLLVPLRMLHS